MTSMLDSIKINKTGRIRDPEQAAAHQTAGGPIRSADDIAAALTNQFIAAAEHDVENVPRNTVLKMLGNKQLDEPFVFSVAKGEGDNYVQAMRQVLTRTRKKAAKKKIRLAEFKLYTLNIEAKEDHDIVTLMRTKQMPAHLESVYDDLIDAFQK